MSLIVQREHNVDFKMQHIENPQAVSGDLHLYKRPGDYSLHKVEIPRNFVKLNIRNQLIKFHPNELPNMDTIGYAIRKILEECGVKNYISAEDRGWELSDYWATLEAIFIPTKDYEEGILAKVNGHAEKIFKTQKSDTNLLICQKELECPITHEIMKDPVMGSDGHTYERVAIEEWLSKNPRSPLTNENMRIQDLRPNFALKKIIQLFLS